MIFKYVRAMYDTTNMEIIAAYTTVISKDQKNYDGDKWDVRDVTG